MLSAGLAKVTHAGLPTVYFSANFTLYYYAQASAAVSALSELLTSPANATSFFAAVGLPSLTILSTPIVTTETYPRRMSDDAERRRNVIIIGSASGAAVVLLLGGLCAVRRYRRRRAARAADAASSPYPALVSPSAKASPKAHRQKPPVAHSALASSTSSSLACLPESIPLPEMAKRPKTPGSAASSPLSGSPHSFSDLANETSP